MKWPMTDGEITAMFRDAKDKDEQVKILADMNLVTKNQMYNKLKELGCDMSGIREPRVKTGGRVKEPIDELRAMELYNEGLDDLAISESLGCSLSKVSAWRRMMKLPKHAETLVQEVQMPEDVKADDIPVAEESQAPAYMTAGALLKILQRVCDGYKGDEVMIRSEGLNVRDVIVSVSYNAAGLVNSVQLDLMTD